MHLGILTGGSGSGKATIAEGIGLGWLRLGWLRLGWPGPVEGLHVDRLGVPSSEAWPRAMTLGG